jgi:large subunit ribosomal protein L4
VPKTKSLVEAMRSWGVGESEYALLITADYDETVWKSGRNVGRLQMNAISGLRLYDVLRADKIVIERSALKHIQEFYGSA